MEARLTVDALHSAVARRGVAGADTVSCTVHSNRGSQAASTGRRNTLIVEVSMGRPAEWMRELTGRAAMRSPGRRRRQPRLGRLTPTEYETTMTTNQAQAA
jgi:putative transposase